MASRNGAAEYDTHAILNYGVIAHAAPSRGRRRPAREKTLIVTGLARSGTSMVAALLLEAGISLGDHVYQPINEDAEITQMLRARDLARLDALIARQNSTAPVWGYEKALVFPQDFIESLLSFCGIAADEARRTSMLGHVQPNRAHYVLTSKRTFEGNLEGVLDGKLYGWARHIGNLSPVLLDLVIDERLAAIFQAADFRSDLLAAGVGNGNHGFFLDLRQHDVADASVIKVRLSRRTFELANSGKSLAELRALRGG